MRIWAVATRIIKQFWYDKRTLGLIILAPMLVLLLCSRILLEEPYSPRIAIVALPPQVSELLAGRGVILEVYVHKDAAIQAVHREQVDAFLELDGTQPVLVLEGSNPTASRAVLQHIHTAFRAGTDTPVSAQVSYLYGGENMVLFDQVGPVLIGFLVFFFVFITSGVSFLRERTNGTLERLLATPIKRWELVLGYGLGFGVFTSLQAVTISWFAVKVLNILFVGRMTNLIFVTMLLAISALTLGILLSAFAQNEFQIVQFIPVVIIPQFLFSGLFRLEDLPGGLRLLGSIMPIKYGANALRQIMLRGKSWPEVAYDASALIAFSLLFGILNVLALKKHRPV